MKGKRTDRLAHQIRDEISQLIQRGELKDPRIGFVSIPGVRISKDLKYAKVFVSVFGEKNDGKKSVEALQNAQGYIRKLLGKALHIRQVPELTFILDHSIEEGIRITQLVSQLPDVQKMKEEEKNDTPPSEETE